MYILQPSAACKPAKCSTCLDYMLHSSGIHANLAMKEATKEYTGVSLGGENILSIICTGVILSGDNVVWQSSDKAILEICI